MTFKPLSPSILSALLSLVVLPQSSITSASAATFQSTYTGEVIFNSGGEIYGKANFTNYGFTAVYTYDTSMGFVSGDAIGQRFEGPVSVSINIEGLVLNLSGSAASYVLREQTLPTASFPYYQNFATDEVFTGPGLFSGDYFAAGLSFISQKSIALIPPSVTTPFSVDFSGPTLDNIGSFSFGGGLAEGALTSTNLVVSQVPLPATAPMFGAALLALAGFSYGMNRWVAPKAEAASGAV